VSAHLLNSLKANRWWHGFVSASGEKYTLRGMIDSQSTTGKVATIGYKMMPCVPANETGGE
jgi:hypothetical protein